MHMRTIIFATVFALAAASCDRPDESLPPDLPPSEAPPRSEAPAPPTDAATPPPGVASSAPAAAFTGGPVAGAERAFVAEAAASGLAEVEAGRLVGTRTEDPALKSFADAIERAHRSSNEELQRIASAKGIDLPATPEGEPRERLNRLSGLSGGELRRGYLHEFGVESHRSAIELFERQASEGQDPELRAFAERTLPILREHLAMAQQLQGGGVGGRTGGAP
jgi:putative membrane protein